MFSVRKLMKLAVPLTLIVLAAASVIVGAVFGPEYLEAVNAMRVVTVAGLISLLIFWVNPVLLSFGRPGIRNIVDIMTSISFIILLYLSRPGLLIYGRCLCFSGEYYNKSIRFDLRPHNFNKKKHYSLKTQALAACPLSSFSLVSE